jgi:folate-binding protein YgfZ
VLVLGRPTLLGIEGPGAVTCLQGLLTNDVEKPGDCSLIYAGLLTPKGMIAVDFWVMRHGGAFLLLADPLGREPALELFGRQLPPRLARVTDHSEAWEAIWLLGGGAAEMGQSLGCVPDLGPGQAALVECGPRAVWVGRAKATAPFAWVVAGPPEALAGIEASLRDAGAAVGTRSDLRAARVLAGFPTLGADIGAKTLPQEVRFDEIDGVSYTKGCYVGQETVARIHFRGHPNWLMRGVVPTNGRPLSDGALELEDRTVGSVTTLLEVEGEPGLALARLRHEVEPGMELRQGEGTVQVVALPFNSDLAD